MTAPERIWIDAWGGNCSTVSGGTQRTEYIRADLAQTAPRDEVIARLVEAAEKVINSYWYSPDGIITGMYDLESSLAAAKALKP